MRALFAAAAALLCAACRGPDEEGAWTTVAREDLAIEVEVVGALEATDSMPIKPPNVPDRWDFKIAQLADEGADVKQGAVVVAFDPSELARLLLQKQAEADAAAKELEKKERDAAMARQDEALRLAEAEAQLRKALLKAEVPEDLGAAVARRTAELDLELARAEVRHQRERAEESRRRDAASLQSLAERAAWARGRAREIAQSIEMLEVKAPRDGTIVFPMNWRGEKKKAGDNVWRMETVLEVVSLDGMRARAEVDEADMSRVRVGQPATLLLDAYTDRALRGTVRQIANTVQRRSPQDPVKVVRVDVALEKAEGIPLRPGMRFRGRIEVERVPGAVTLPADAVFASPEGPFAWRKTATGHERVPLTLGRRTPRAVEVLAGLSPGDQVSRGDLAEEAR